ncbi:hypothetical protein K431DRAFT_225683 [Polychaeton citri CBS 116435]|uniref:Prion-inhibition and propagation HeLo domain-containing protein n=1 Tax=Polychaeton citri CBS 116435 TaxID=1314669 RepID=A0A9P4UPG4_9PEZI|nr:hypothetical protein K431DRAFT_225683 [Polychaeton citri CBS 116435]
MAADKADNKAVDHEAVLTGVIILAALYSNCVEAFNLIHPGPKWVKDEQLELAKLGIVQARLLIWGDIMGITSPPRSVTNRAVPRHPSAAYPDVKEPTFFTARDHRLDEPAFRTQVEDALNAIADRSAGLSREQMMEKFGLKPPKKFINRYQPATDVNRLEGFREKYELLQEVAETYARINTSRQGSIAAQAWQIADTTRFATFIKLTQEKVDLLIQISDVEERVNRAIRVDIRALGWHLTADRTRIAQDISKLRLIQEAHKDEYPVAVRACNEALANIEREKRENAEDMAEKLEPTQPHQHNLPKSNGHLETKSDKHGKRPGLFGIFRSFRKDKHPEFRTRNASVAAQGGSDDAGPERSLSHPGHATDGPEVGDGDDDFTAPLTAVRSKSLGDIQAPYGSIDDELSNRLGRVNTNSTGSDVDGLDTPQLEQMETLKSMISRHDQFHGIARTATKDLRQY